MTEVEVLEKKVDKEYVPDTNVLISNPFAVYILTGNDFPREDLRNAYLEVLARLEFDYGRTPNDIYIHEVVEKELDHVTHGKDPDAAHDARMAGVILNRIRERGLNKCRDGVYSVLDNGARVFFSRHDEKDFAKNQPFSPDNDDRIVHFVKKLADRDGKKKQVLFVSQDTFARSRALDKFCTAQDFHYENIRDPNQLYTGIASYQMNDDILELITDGSGEFDVESLQQHFHRRLRPNQILAFTDETGNIIDYRFAHFTSDTTTQLRPFRYEQLLERRRQLNVELRKNQPEIEKILKQLTNKAFKKYVLTHDKEEDKLPLFIAQLNEAIDPRGSELLQDQTPYFELLADDNVPLVSVNGPQGTGKTLLAVLAGLLKLERNAHERIRYMRPLIGTDQSLGFYKGGFNEKIERWIQPCEDALEEIFGYNNTRKPKERQLIDLAIEKLKVEGVIEYDVATHVAGSTWRNEWVIIDEAQYFNRRQMKLLIGRVGKGTKLILSGDLSQTAFAAEHYHSRVNERNSGLAHIMERLPGERVYGHITFPKSENVHRSDVAGLASKL